MIWNEEMKYFQCTRLFLGFGIEWRRSGWLRVYIYRPPTRRTSVTSRRMVVRPATPWHDVPPGNSFLERPTPLLCIPTCFQDSKLIPYASKHTKQNSNDTPKVSRYKTWFRKIKTHTKQATATPKCSSEQIGKVQDVTNRETK